MNNKLLNQAVGHVVIELNAKGNTNFETICSVCSAVKVMMWYLYGDDIFDIQDLIDEVSIFYKQAA